MLWRTRMMRVMRVISAMWKWWRGYVVALRTGRVRKPECHKAGLYSFKCCRFFDHSWYGFLYTGCSHAGSECLWHLYVCSLVGNGLRPSDRHWHVYCNQPSYCRDSAAPATAYGGGHFPICLEPSITEYAGVLWRVYVVGIAIIMVVWREHPYVCGAACGRRCVAIAVERCCWGHSARSAAFRFAGNHSPV